MGPTAAMAGKQEEILREPYPVIISQYYEMKDWLGIAAQSFQFAQLNPQLRHGYCK
jgi:hypothetical protein